jgi:hypothetical protein
MRLEDSGVAWLQDFPQGESTEEDGDEAACLQRSSDALYTGEAHWERESYSFRLTFEGSDIVVYSGPARFFSVNWDDPIIVECGDPMVRWAFHLECGRVSVQTPEEDVVRCEPLEPGGDLNP